MPKNEALTLRWMVIKAKDGMFIDTVDSNGGVSWCIAKVHSNIGSDDTGEEIANYIVKLHNEGISPE